MAVSADLIQMGSHLAGRQYTATGFNATPGAVVNGQVVVNQASLSQAVFQDGRACVTESSVGTFMIRCVPSLGSGAPPPPDPAASGRTGRWRVMSAGQSVATG